LVAVEVAFDKLRQPRPQACGTLVEPLRQQSTLAVVEPVETTFLDGKDQTMTRRMNLRTAVSILIVSTTAFAQSTRHPVEPGAKGNTITLEVINKLPTTLTDLSVAINTSPTWVKITGADVGTDLAAYSSGEAAIGFDVLSSAKSREEGDIIIVISSHRTPLAEKTISLTVAPPSMYKLSQNYPNPFNPTTTIEYQLPVAGHITLKVYDLLGREVATLVNEVQQADYYRVEFDGGRLASGVYFYRLHSGSYSATKRLMFLK
jgi:hypothetical protein